MLRFPQLERVRQKDPINRGREIDHRRRRTGQAQWILPQSRKNTIDRQLAWARHACVMPAKCMKLMRIRGGDERFSKSRGHVRRAPVWIEQSLVEMTKLNRV